MNGWIGFDLDGTLAHYDNFISPTHIGEPIQPILDLLIDYIRHGHEVRIFTARIYWPDGDEKRYQDAQDALEAIKKWCIKHIGKELPVTCVKDYSMWLLYDDRCVQVEKNTGRLIGAK